MADNSFVPYWTDKWPNDGEPCSPEHMLLVIDANGTVMTSERNAHAGFTTMNYAVQQNVSMAHWNAMTDSLRALLGEV